jgi:hypothetical protein
MNDELSNFLLRKDLSKFTPQKMIRTEEGNRGDFGGKRGKSGENGGNRGKNGENRDIYGLNQVASGAKKWDSDLAKMTYSQYSRILAILAEDEDEEENRSAESSSPPLASAQPIGEDGPATVLRPVNHNIGEGGSPYGEVGSLDKTQSRQFSTRRY